MNTNNVKKYAPKARKAFIEAMSKQAAKYGITKKKIEPAEQKGDLVLIGDRPFPASVIKPRERLVKRIEQQGFDQIMEHVAYSWFNRLCAIRYMERKGFLDHGRRVLSAADGSAGVPQILEECLDVELPGLDQAKVRELKLDGTKDEELYRELLLAQCHALHQAMPFLFEAVADESELLLPENLTKTDSLIRDLVASVPDEDWEHIEIIGWLYQFYISDKKDQVIGKVVKSEDIPAATQLFTPNWIVQYLVQNSVGRQWLQTYPDSPLKEKMPYYIEPAEQTPEVQAQLAAITPSDITPESIKVLDPACGSGHILVEAYKVLKAIYEERGYRTRDIPQLILENNLFGLDIDDRAGQLAGFALMMLAREDDRRIFSRSAAAGGKLCLNVLSLQESANVNLPSLWKSLNLTGEWQSGTSQGLFEEEQQGLSAFAADNRYQLLQRTLDRFKQAKTFGSLIEVPHDDCEELKKLFVTLRELDNSGDSMQKSAASQLLPYVHQAVILAQKFDAVVANPPYMGSKGMNADLKEFAKKEYPNSKSDLFAVFIERGFGWLKDSGFNSMVTMQSWMFLSSYEQMRESILSRRTIENMVHMGNGVMKIAFGTNATVFRNLHLGGYQGHFSYANNDDINDDGVPFEFPVKNERLKVAASDDFKKIPGSPIAYWVTDDEREQYRTGETLSDISFPRKGLDTGENDVFLRFWHEVSLDSTCLDNTTKQAKWYPYNKGGEYRRWYGNREYVINWKDNGKEIKSRLTWDKKKPTIRNSKFYFRRGLSWTTVSSGGFSARYCPEGALFDNGGCTLFADSSLDVIGAFINSKIASRYLEFLSPTLNFQPGDVGRILFPKHLSSLCVEFNKCVEIAKKDWDWKEFSWDFARPRMLDFDSKRVLECYEAHNNECLIISNELQKLEVENNKLFDQALSLQSNCEVNIDKVSLFSNVHYVYKDEETIDRKRQRFQSDSLVGILSYSVGCMLGRYSLDREGLIYARSGNVGFEGLVSEGAYKTFPADDDGIIPLTDQEWFPDDATNRFREFVKVVWGEDHLQENLEFVAESLCLHAIKPKKSESSMDTIRRYLSTQFYKDHLKTYKKRPIYWLFSSGKQKAFECLVYLHRYNEGTLARMRTEYVIPLTAKMAAYAQKLENDKEASGSAAEVKRLEKEIAQLHKQQAELSEFDEKLRHYADQRISLDLDDGVKVNYGKFGDLLAEVKAVTGEAPEVLS